MRNSGKSSLWALLLLTVVSFCSGGCVDGYAGGGSALKTASQFSKSRGAGAAAYAIGDVLQTTGDYNAAERAGSAGATNIYINGDGTITPYYNQEEAASGMRWLREKEGSNYYNQEEAASGMRWLREKEGSNYYNQEEAASGMRWLREKEKLAEKNQ